MPDSRIFMCYRRQDGGDRADRLHDALDAHFRTGEVFIDLFNVPPGVDIRRHITQRLSSCDVLLVVIGPAWLTITDERGQRRLDSETDYVSLEIATALKGGIPIVPLLVKGAAMPSADELPPGLVRIAELNALALTDGVHWRDDVRRLIATLEQILAARPGSAPAAPPARQRRVRPVLASTAWATIARRRRLSAIVLAGAAAAAVAVLHDGPGAQPLRIYSSLPEREQRQPRSVTRSSAARALGVSASTRIADMENAMRLALDDAGSRAGRFAVSYVPLDASDETGASSPAAVQANARRAVGDDRTAAYIGDLTSGSSQTSIPILSLAQVPQISPGSTRVGLTTKDPRGDIDEPGRYYPPQPGYAGGYRNFVRIIPRDTVQAKALLALISQQDGCRRVALVDDDSPYGEALSNNIRTFNRHRVRIVFSQSVGPYGRYGYLVALARALKADCFVYTGSRNPNTVDIFKAFARALPAARLYGSDGQVTASFYDPAEQGLPADVADRVQIMVPPRNAARYNVFARGFARRYGHRPDPSAVYAYEAMRLALAAIGRSNGHRDDIVRRLMDTAADDLSMLGGYSIRPRTGDTDLALYGVSRISDGRLTAPRHAPRLLADISAPA